MTGDFPLHVFWHLNQIRPLRCSALSSRGEVGLFGALGFFSLSRLVNALNVS